MSPDLGKARAAGPRRPDAYAFARERVAFRPMRLLASLVWVLVLVSACGGSAEDPKDQHEHDAAMAGEHDAAVDADADAASAHDAGSAGSAAKSSDELIEAALASGTLDSDTALSYRVFAAFGDARLPAAYESAVQQIGGTRAMGELAARFGELPA